MKAILCRAWGGPDELRFEEEVAPPALGPGQIRMRVRACDVNFADTLMIAGKYQVKPALPFVPGLAAAGEVIECGGAVEHLRVGQRVFAYLRSGGADAEEAVVDAGTAMAIPDGMDYVTAAAFPIAYGTSHLALIHRGRLKAGETVLVLGAAGGVGLTAVEIAKVLGARVIAAAGGPERLAVCKAHGADELIDYRTESIRDRVRALTGGLGADVVYDAVGGDAFDQALRAINFDGRMLVVGFAGGRIQAVPANLVLLKNISIVGVTWGSHYLRQPEPVTAGLAELLRWWQDGRLKPIVSKTFPLAEAGAAMQALLSRRYPGRIVLEP